MDGIEAFLKGSIRRTETDVFTPLVAAGIVS